MRDDDIVPPRPASEIGGASEGLSAKQRDVLAAVRSHPDGATVTAIANQLGLHINSVRGHLDQLVEKALVGWSPLPAEGRGRPTHIYWARTPSRVMIAEEQVALVEVLVSAAAGEDVEAARALGRQWARAQADPGDGTAFAATRALANMGFDPVARPEEESEGVSVVGLRACPFISRDGKAPPPTVCAMHEGFLDEAAGPLKVELKLFDRPGQCGVRFTRGGSS